VRFAARLEMSHRDTDRAAGNRRQSRELALEAL
jgi:hypothetical protein